MVEDIQKTLLAKVAVPVAAPSQRAHNHVTLSGKDQVWHGPIGGFTTQEGGRKGVDGQIAAAQRHAMTAINS